MGVPRSAQRFGRAAVRACERAKITWEFALKFIPSFWEIRVLIPMRAIGNVIALANVGRSSIGTTIGGMVTQRLHF
jgi:hypothetical protein